MKEVKFWEFLTKVYFQYYEEVQIIAMGRAIHVAVRTSDNIISKELCEYKLIKTFIAKKEAKKTKKK